MQLSMIHAVQNGDIAIEGSTAHIESVAADYWSGRLGLGVGATSIFPFRRTSSQGNVYIIHRDVHLYLSLLFTGDNIDFLYEYQLKGVDGEFSQELKDEVHDEILRGNSTIELTGVLKCEAFSNSFRGYGDLTPVAGVEVSMDNPLEGSAEFYISKRIYDRIMREQKETRRETWRAPDDFSQDTPEPARKRGMPSFL